MAEEDRSPRPDIQVLNRLHSSHANERRRIARYLHDQIAHTLVIALNSLELHEAHLRENPALAMEQLHGAVGMVRRTLDTVRALSLDLRSSNVDGGLESALTKYLRILGAPNDRWTVQVTGYEARLPGDVRDELYLILREAAHNSLIHSSARHLRITVEVGCDAVRAVAEDDGSGFDVDQHLSGSGLAGMLERAELLGGSTTVVSAPGAGTRITVEIPLFAAHC
jgi:signal transduction histidine kinase